MAIRIVTKSISPGELKEIAKGQFGDFVKAVVDIEKGIMAVGGELHADEEVVLSEQGSERKNTWGINIYVEKTGDDWIEFDSMINIKPRYNNRSRGVEDRSIQDKIRETVNELVSK